jgi:hypothetical protein
MMACIAPARDTPPDVPSSRATATVRGRVGPRYRLEAGHERGNADGSIWVVGLCWDSDAAAYEAHLALFFGLLQRFDNAALGIGQGRAMPKEVAR